MTTFLDTVLVPQAKSLITRFGPLVSYRRLVKAGEPFDVENLAVEKEFETAISVRAIIDPVLSQQQGLGVGTRDDSPNDSTAAHPGAHKVHIAGSEIAFTPQVGDEVYFESAWWRVAVVQSVPSGDEIALYTLWVTD